MGSTYQAVSPSCNWLLLGEKIPAVGGLSGSAVWGFRVLPSWKLTYYPFQVTFEDVVPFPRSDMLVPWSVGFRAQQQSRWTLFCFVGSITTLQWLFFGYQSVGQVKWSWRIYMSDIYMCASKRCIFLTKRFTLGDTDLELPHLFPTCNLVILSWCALTSNPQIWWTWRTRICEILDITGPSWKVLAKNSMSGYQVGFSMEFGTRNKPRKKNSYTISIFCWFHVQFFFRGWIASKQKWRPFNFFGDSPNHGYSGPPFLLRYHRKVICAKSEVAAFWRQLCNFCRDVWVL